MRQMIVLAMATALVAVVSATTAIACHASVRMSRVLPPGCDYKLSPGGATETCTKEHPGAFRIYGKLAGRVILGKNPTLSWKLTCPNHAPVKRSKVINTSTYNIVVNNQANRSVYQLMRRSASCTIVITAQLPTGSHTAGGLKINFKWDVAPTIV